MDQSQIQRLDSKLNELHDFEKLDLGYTDKEMYGDCSLTPYDHKKERNKKRYPSVHISRLKTDPFDLPDTGEAKIKFKVVSRETTNRDGKTRNTASIEIQSMDIDKEKKKKDLESLCPGMINFTDPRPRNQQGMFADSTEAGADPETMKKAYGGNTKFSNSQIKALRRKLPRGLAGR